MERPVPGDNGRGSENILKWNRPLSVPCGMPDPERGAEALPLFPDPLHFEMIQKNGWNLRGEKDVRHGDRGGRVFPKIGRIGDVEGILLPDRLDGTVLAKKVDRGMIARKTLVV